MRFLEQPGAHNERPLRAAAIGMGVQGSGFRLCCARLPSWRALTQLANSCPPPLKRWATRRTALVAFSAVCLLTLNSGCAAWSYENIKLGQTPSEYSRALPEAGRVQTEIGLCSLYRRESTRLWGSDHADRRTESIVLLLTADRRVAGKFRAVTREKSGGILPLGKSSYELAGELSPDLYGTSGATTTDTIRALVADLMDTIQPKVAVDAHSLVAGGLVRLVWPETEDPGISEGMLEELLKLVPGDGERFTELRDDGVLAVRYFASF